MACLEPRQNGLSLELSPDQTAPSQFTTAQALGSLAPVQEGGDRQVDSKPKRKVRKAPELQATCCCPREGMPMPQQPQAEAGQAAQRHEEWTRASSLRYPEPTQRDKGSGRSCGPGEEGQGGADTGALGHHPLTPCSPSSRHSEGPTFGMHTQSTPLTGNLSHKATLSQMYPLSQDSLSIIRHVSLTGNFFHKVMLSQGTSFSLSMVLLVHLSRVTTGVSPSHSWHSRARSLSRVCDYAVS